VIDAKHRRSIIMGLMRERPACLVEPTKLPRRCDLIQSLASDYIGTPPSIQKRGNLLAIWSGAAAIISLRTQALFVGGKKKAAVFKVRPAQSAVVESMTAIASARRRRLSRCCPAARRQTRPQIGLSRVRQGAAGTHGFGRAFMHTVDVGYLLRASMHL